MPAEKERRLYDDGQCREAVFPPRREKQRTKKPSPGERSGAALTETQNPASIAEAGFSMRIFQQIFSSMVC